MFQLEIEKIVPVALPDGRDASLFVCKTRHGGVVELLVLAARSPNAALEAQFAGQGVPFFGLSTDAEERYCLAGAGAEPPEEPPVSPKVPTEAEFAEIVRKAPKDIMEWLAGKLGERGLQRGRIPLDAPEGPPPGPEGGD